MEVAVKQHDVKLSSRIAYGYFGLGSNFIGGLLGSFLTLYLTDNLLLSSGFIAGMMLICRFTNGVGELLVGLLIDKTHTRWGKARPWIIAGSFLCALPVWLIFTTPTNLGETGRQIWIAVMYFLHTSVFGAMVSVADQALIVRMSKQSYTRTSMLILNTLLGQVGGMITGSWGIPMLLYFGGYETGYKWMSLIFCIGGFLGMLGTGMLCKELPDDDLEEFKDRVKSKNTKDNVWYQYKCIFENRYMACALAMYILAFFTTMLMGSSAVYFARDVLNNAEFMAQITLATGIPAIIIMLIGIVPKIVSKFGIRIALLITTSLNVIGMVVMALNPSSATFIFIGKIICGIAGAIYVPIIGTVVADIADLVNLKYDFDAAGKVTSICSAGMKIGMGLGSVGVVVALNLGGYSAKLANNGMSQTASALFAEKACFIYIPLICFILITLLATTMNIEEKLAKLRDNKV